MTRMPERAVPEVCVALAGPAVNAALLAAGLLLGARVNLPWRAEGEPIVNLEPPTYLDIFASVNFALAAFNLAPAFPMDGGRALRGALSARFGYLQATEIAVRIGRWFAVAAVAAAWFYTDMFVPVLLIGVFLWFQGAQELADVRMRYGIHPLQAAFEKIFGAGRKRPESPHPDSRQAPDDRGRESAGDLPRELENYRGSMEEFFRERGRDGDRT
jgi:stage IV sporulation protein FB